MEAREGKYLPPELLLQLLMRGSDNLTIQDVYHQQLPLFLKAI